MSSFQLIVGSMLGGSEYVAEAVSESLEQAGHTTNIHFSPSFGEINIQNQTWIICTSTHGAGELPDNIKSFAQDLENTKVNLAQLKFAIIGLGDSSYDTFCNAAKNIEKLMNSKNCIKLLNTFFIDVHQDIDPEDEAKAWIENNNLKF